MTHLLPTPLGVVDLHMPLWLATSLALIGPVVAGITLRWAWSKLTRGRAHRRRAAAPETRQRLRISTPPDGNPAVAPLPKRVPGRWVGSIGSPFTDPAADADPAARHPSQIPGPRRYPLDDAVAAPLDDLVAKHRVDLALQPPRLFDPTYGDDVTTRIPTQRFRSGSWADEAHTGGAR